MAESEGQSEYKESFEVLRKCLVNIPDYIRKYLLTGNNIPSEVIDSRVSDIGKCLLAGAEDSKSAEPSERDVALYMNFAYNVCRITDGFPGHMKAVDAMALRFLETRESTEPIVQRKQSLYNFLLENASQRGYGYYGVGIRVVKAGKILAGKLARYKNTRNLAERGSRILLENLSRTI